MNIIKHTTRSLVENVYIVEKNKACFVIDPGFDFDGIKKILEENGLNLQFIILTHGHGDHIGSVKELKSLYNVPIYAHKLEEKLLNDPNMNLSSAMYGDISIEADYYLEEGHINIKGFDLNIIHTPGHTAGGICILIDGHIFTGDTLFHNAIGRWDLPTSNYDDLIYSLKNKLMCLNDDIIIHPGHNSDSTIGRERINNPYLS